MAFTPLMKRPEDVSKVQWLERCRERVLSLQLDPEVQNNLLIWQWLLSGLIVDPSEIKFMMEGPMFESSTYRSVLQKGFEKGLEEGREEGRQQGIEQGERKNAIKSILKVLDTRFHIGTEQNVQLLLETIEDLQRLEVLLQTAVQAESFAAFAQTLLTNGK